jgi:outer membrane protein insertion porin family
MFVMRIKSFIALVLGLGIVTSQSQETFKIHAIRVEGLQRVDVGTVYNELPIEPGDEASPEVLSESLRSLYQSGFFEDVKFAREGNDLVISVQERPAIGSIDVEGNKDIKKEDLLKALKSMGISEGRTFDRTMLERMEKELEQQYFSRGKYNVDITSTVTPLERNRVAVKININEGSAAKIRQITIIGNEAFSEKDLLKQLESTTPGWLTWYSKRDQYSKERIRGDLETLTSYYMDRGYINFEITSTQVSITPDKKDIYITITINEGQQYKVKETRLAGEFVVPEEELKKFIFMKPDTIFSRREMTTTTEVITERVGNDGYAFAKVNPIPEKNDEDHTVIVTFFIDPGKRVYVRRINVEGNDLTRDDVIRQYLGQMEAAPVSNGKIQSSRNGLLRTGFFDDVTVDKTPVPGTTDQVDLDLKVTERRSGKLTGGVGFSQSEGFTINAGVSQDNFLGSGQQVGFDFQNTKAATSYRATFEEPFHTVDAISRAFTAYYNTVDLEKINVSGYVRDSAGFGIGYGIPISPYQRFNFGLGYDNTYIKLTNDVDDLVNASPNAATCNSPYFALVALQTGVPLELLNFICDNGQRFNAYNLSAGWLYNKLDRAVYPTRGFVQNIRGQIAVPGSDLTVYKVETNAAYYKPLFGSFILNAKGGISFGDGYGDTSELPFFQNYYAGGPSSVRGYRENTLGPRDTTNSPMGGNLRVNGTLELIFKMPYVETKSVRTSIFLDAGNVFSTYGDDLVPSAYKEDTIRLSAGFATRWLSPMGPLIFSLAKPLNDQNGDELESFQFTVGSDF